METAILPPNLHLPRSPMSSLLIEEVTSNAKSGITSRSCEQEDDSTGIITTYLEDYSRPSINWFATFVELLSKWLDWQEFSADSETNKSMLQSYDLSLLPTSKSILTSQELDLDPIFQEWEWILSQAEIFAMKKDQEEAELLKKELSLLRERGNKLKMKPLFVGTARDLMMDFSNTLSLDDWTKLTVVVLDSSKRSKLMADIVDSFSKGWLQFIQTEFFSDEYSSTLWHLFEDEFNETTYKKGVKGSLKAVAWKASHGVGGCGLTFSVLGDIGWSLWNSLSSAISWVLNRDLEREEQTKLAEKVLACMGPLSALWLSTVKKSMNGTSLMGIVVQRFAEEEQREQERIKQIKNKGVDARYEYHRTVVANSEKKPIFQLRQLLESQLHFHQS